MIENSILKSDAVVIPVRTGFFDIDAVTPVVEICKRRRKRYGFLFAAVDSKMPKLAEAAMSALVGRSLLPTFGTSSPTFFQFSAANQPRRLINPANPKSITYGRR